MARIRSPNYPSMSLQSAIDKVRTVHKAEGKNSISRESLARIIGFGGINGASAAALSALSKYGLIEGADDGEARVTDLAVKVLFPDNEEERREALLDAAQRPILFKEIKEKWPERPPSDDNLRTFLVRKGFNQSSLDQVIQIYRDTIDIAGTGLGGHDSVNSSKEDTMQQPARPSATQSPISPAFQPTAPTAPILSSRPFSVSFDGAVLTGTIAIKSVKDIDRLMKVLSAQKVAFEAMEDDEGEPDAWGREGADKLIPPD